ncbi:MAG TPA: hypothetical protein VMV94_06755 [Phycisphaerae bacterium]|nr:hypothetical protein [Phycisphaerae bacterium]
MSSKVNRRPPKQALPTQPPHSLRPTILVIALIIVLGIAVRVPLLPQPGYLPDMQQFFMWAYQADRHGLASVYDRYEVDGQVQRLSNYPPLYLHVLRGIAKLYPLVAGRPLNEPVLRAMSLGEPGPGVAWGYVLFKLPAALADIATAVVLFICLRRRLSIRAAGAIGVLYALHPMAIHNSSAWGQVDAIHTLFMVLSLDAAARRRLPAMTAWAVLALLMKMQSIFIAPIWLVVAVMTCRALGAQAGRQIALSAVVAVVLIAAVVWPFGIGADSGPFDAYFKAVGYFPYVHMNGFSAWFLTNPIPGVPLTFNPYLRDDMPWVLGISARKIGLVATAATAILVAIVLWRRKCDSPGLRWAARLLPLAFFVLPTQIHERYLFPIIALWAWACESNRRWWVCWIVLSVCGFLNAVWVFPGPAGRPLADFLRAELHPGSVGPLVGICCALAMLVVLFVAILDLRFLPARSAPGNESAPALEDPARPGTMAPRPASGTRKTPASRPR